MNFGLQNPAEQTEPKTRTGVLIHGCHLQAAGWDEVVWGRDSKLMGRLPQGMLMALELNAELIVVGSGASSRMFEDQRSERCGQVLREAEYTLETLRCRFDDLNLFPAWRNIVADRSLGSWELLKARLLDIVVTDLQSQTTVDELKYAGQRFKEQGIQRVILITSPTHLPRVIRDATVVFHSDPDFASFRDHILAVPSLTNFVGTCPSDVMVLEPPHRPDRNPQVLNSMRRLIDTDRNDETGLIGVLGEISDMAKRRQTIS